MGIPIPFCSIGAVSRELWALGSAGSPIRDALAKNAWQVRRYLNEYGGGSKTGRLDWRRVSTCSQIYEKAARLHATEPRLPDAAETSAEVYEQFLECAGQLARDQWTQFSIVPMVFGILLLALSFAVLWALSFYGTFSSVVSPLDVAVGAVFVVYPFLLFSDSYIWEEPRLVNLLCSWVLTLVQLKSEVQHWLRLKHDGALVPTAKRCNFLGWVISLLSIRLLAWIGHKEPQHRTYVQDLATDSFVGTHLSRSLSISSHVIARVALGAVVLLRKTKPGFHSVSQFVGSTLPVLLLLCWHSIEDLSSTTELTFSELARGWIFSRNAFAVSFLRDIFELPLRLLVPRTIFALTGASFSSIAAQKVFARFGSNLFSDPATDAVWVMLPFLMTLYGREGPLLACLGLSLVLGLKQVFVAASPVKTSFGGQPERPDDVTKWHCICGGAILTLLGQHLFYCTGHTSQFTGLQYTAGFVGFDSFQYTRAGFLLAANTFGPHVLAAFLVPQAARWLRGLRSGERQPTASNSCLTWVALGFALSRSGLLLAATLSAALQRRHLMAWSLFAPRFVFESTTALAANGGLLLALALSGRH
uniref:Gpi ethanolamine phosphate transferase 3-like isoform x1 n=1 Tax=Tetraselmis sp. GSL018 TaxID=582737 RepID=A0A061SPD4_9CHLO